MADDPYRAAPDGMPTADEVRQLECRHIEYRKATKADGPERLDVFPFVCIDCGRRLID